MKKTIFKAYAVFAAALFVLQTYASAENTSFSWYFKPSGNHEQPEVIPEAKSFIDKYDTIYLGDEKSNKIYLTFDAGYTYYWYPSSDSPSTNEMKFGISYDASALLGDFNVTPSLYYYYDWDLHNNTVEASLSYYAPVSKWLFEKDIFGINTSVCYGYVGSYRNSYGYVSVISNLVLKLTDYASLSAGVRYAYHNDDDSSSDASNNRVWFGSAISFGF